MAALYRAHDPAAVRLASLLTGDTAGAQDIAHEAFLRAAGRLGLLHDPDRFAAYLRQLPRAAGDSPRPAPRLDERRRPGNR